MNNFPSDIFYIYIYITFVREISQKFSGDFVPYRYKWVNSSIVLTLSANFEQSSYRLNKFQIIEKLPFNMPILLGTFQ